MKKNPDPAPDHLLSRRTLLQRGGLGLVGLSALPLGGAGLIAAEPKKKAATAAPTTDLVPLQRFPRTVQEYYVRRVRAEERAGEMRRAALRTKAAAEAYVRDVRTKIQQCFGPFPARTPLNARVTRVLDRDGYKIENVIFESRPGFPVTANLYVPTGRNRPMPGVIGTCGHSDNGKAADAYQSFAQGLARQGYVVLIFDPMGQGERLQHVDAALKARHGVGTNEHNYEGNRMTLSGEFIGSWFAWDAIRALDYLLTRPEVDPKHIGLTGNSGGGTQATWLCALEPRFTMAAPSCFVTTWRRNIENEEIADFEQCPPRVLAMGLDHADFIVAMAPKPVILMGQEKDFFDARGLEEAFGRVRAIYRLLGAEDKVRHFVGPDYHGYSQANREAMYGWFNGQTGIVAGPKEPALTLEKGDALLCTAKGQVGEAAVTTAFTILRDEVAKKQAARGTPGGEALQRALTTTLKLPARTGVPDYRILRPLTGRAYPKRYAATYAVETEPEVHAIVYRLNDAPLTSRPPRGEKRAVLYVAHGSADGELRTEPMIKDVIAAEPSAAIFACDVRGVGETQPLVSTRGFATNYGGNYFHAACGLMFDYPVAGQRTFDVLRVIDWLRDQGHDDVHVVARGWGALPATFAAVLHPAVKQVTLKQALTSYAEVATTADYNWPLAALVPDVLRSFDLPDCYRALEAKRLRQIDPVGAAGLPA
ncbi:alpha/beta hydrolase [Horticoccus sp. 23ND18S-11]|uniref:alpha/beta hydrolase n=1 Tax=Horticoccus sp. 23ND18S-11 TaxID=3391832 RepID=UPI0039C90CBD